MSEWKCEVCGEVDAVYCDTCANVDNKYYEQEIKKLRARIAELEQDGKRLDWILENITSTELAEMGVNIDYDARVQSRAAIDKAIPDSAKN